MSVQLVGERGLSRKLTTTLIVAVLGFTGFRLPAQEPPAGSREQPHATDDVPSGDAWVKQLKDRAKRGTLQEAFQYVRGDSGKWNDEPILQHAPPLGRKPDQLPLDEWADQLLEQDVELKPGDENWLLLRTRQLDDNDRMWIERIERRGNQFTVVVDEAIWQGRYQKTFTYYSVFGINLGKLEPGKYTATVIIKPLTFKQFDGDGRPNGNWPKDEGPAEKKAVELQAAFDVASKRVADPFGHIRASDDGTHFVRADGSRFVLWGVNYDHDGLGRLIDEYYQRVADCCRELSRDQGDHRERGNRHNPTRLFRRTGRS